jgi:hypothetical protein
MITIVSTILRLPCPLALAFNLSKIFVENREEGKTHSIRFPSGSLQ